MLPVTDANGAVVMQVSTAKKGEAIGRSVTTVVDAGGTLVAMLETASREVLTSMAGWSKTWHNIYSVAPRVGGQQPASQHGGTPLYSWAKVCRKPFKNQCDIHLYDEKWQGGHNEAGAPAFYLQGYMGMPPRQFSIYAADQGGAALFTKAKRGKATILEVCVAPDSDAALWICTTIAVLKLCDEIPSSGGGGGGGP